MDARNLTFPGGLILGATLMYLLTRLFARRAREKDESATAFDLDVPNYAWLR